MLEDNIKQWIRSEPVLVEAVELLNKCSEALPEPSHVVFTRCLVKQAKEGNIQLCPEMKEFLLKLNSGRIEDVQQFTDLMKSILNHFKH